jgi:hypothetical protein
MTLTNLSAVMQSDVRLDRYFSARLGGEAYGDRFARTNNSVWGWKNATGQGVLLTTTTPNFTARSAVEYTIEWYEGDGGGAGKYQGCSPNMALTPTFPWDDETTSFADGFTGRLGTLMGRFTPGQVKSITVQYRLL